MQFDMQAKRESQEVPSDYDPSAHVTRSDRAASVISDPPEPASVGGLATEAMDVWRDATDQLREREHEHSFHIAGEALTSASGAKVLHQSCFVSSSYPQTFFTTHHSLASPVFFYLCLYLQPPAVTAAHPFSLSLRWEHELLLGSFAPFESIVFSRLCCAPTLLFH
jgi:hypothetical protein